MIDSTTATNHMVDKAYQRIIREEKETLNTGQSSFLSPPENLSLKNAVVREINFVTASTIILEYEWIGTMPLPKSIRYIYGIYFDGVLGGAIVYVEPSTRQFNKEYPRRVVQLNRGAVAHWTPKNTASRLIGQSFKFLKKENVLAIIAYCTKEAGEIGTIYQACNFIYTGETKPSNVYFLDNHWVSERTLADKIAWAKNKDIKWRNKFNNLLSKKLEGKFRYLYLLGDKNSNNKFINSFGYKSMQYPKRIIMDTPSTTDDGMDNTKGEL